MSNIHDGWMSHLRKASRQAGDKGGPSGTGAGTARTVKCPKCDTGFHPDINIDDFRAHALVSHGSLEDPKEVEKAFAEMTLETT